MANINSKVSVVIPCYNEEKSLDELATRCLSACESMQRPYEIILVDDGSNDLTAEKITALAETHDGKIVSILLSFNCGQHNAVLAGFSRVSGEIVVTLDADLQNPPEEIPTLVSKMDEGFDVVGSVRMNRQDSLMRRVASALVNKVVQKTTGIQMHDYGCMLRAYSNEVVETILQCRERSTFIPILANTFAHRVAEVEVAHSERMDGDSKYSLWKLINLQFDLLTSITTFPLRMLSVLGGLISSFGFGLGVLILVFRLIHGPAWAAEGVFTLFAVLFVFVGAQFVALGLLGEYIGRIYHDVRDRPRYFVHQVVGRDGQSVS
ncbi:MAG: glycosyltransferase [Kiritimatiellales bacterium]|nr:glycosyltransferase [Kiritimatiellales bacterium]